MLQKTNKLFTLTDLDITVQNQAETAVGLSVHSHLQGGGTTNGCDNLDEAYCKAKDGCRWNKEFENCMDDGTGDWD